MNIEETFAAFKSIGKKFRISRYQGLEKIFSIFFQLIAGDEKEMVERTLAEIHEEGPMTGCGYFEITKSSLTSMASISITYVIILMQFKSA